MTLQELQNSSEIWVLPSDIANLTGESPQAIREKAKQGTLEYKYIRTGNRTKIHRKSFLNFLTEV